MRRFGLVVSTVCLLAPLGLELVGVLPSSYVFEGGRMITLPQMTELPRLPTFAFIALANMGSALLPALFVARLRSDLSRMQERQLLQAWQVHRLPQELMRATPR